MRTAREMGSQAGVLPYPELPESAQTLGIPAKIGLVSEEGCAWRGRNNAAASRAASGLVAAFLHRNTLKAMLAMSRTSSLPWHLRIVCTFLR